MRTTIEIDDVTFEELKKVARKRGASLKAVVNEALRAAVLGQEASSTAPTYVCPTFPMGKVKTASINQDKALALAGRLEDEEIVRKLELRK